MSHWPTGKILGHEGKGDNAALFDSGFADLRCLLDLVGICDRFACSWADQTTPRDALTWGRRV